MRAAPCVLRIPQWTQQLGHALVAMQALQIDTPGTAAHKQLGRGGRAGNGTLQRSAFVYLAGVSGHQPYLFKFFVRTPIPSKSSTIISLIKVSTTHARQRESWLATLSVPAPHASRWQGALARPSRLSLSSGNHAVCPAATRLSRVIPAAATPTGDWPLFSKAQEGRLAAASASSTDPQSASTFRLNSSSARVEPRLIDAMGLPCASAARQNRKPE